MNPLPNRPLLNNSSIPLLPHVPAFDQMAYNGRPRKILPDAANLLNGVNSLMSGPSSAPAATAAQPAPPLEPRNPLGSTMLPQHMQQTSQPEMTISQPSPLSNVQGDKDKESDPERDSEPRQLTAIFRPDDDGEWKEKLRLARDASEQARQARDNQMEGGSWGRLRQDNEEDVKEDDGEVEDEESVVGEGEENKNWKTKRTLRK